MAKPRNPDRYEGVPGWVRVVDDYGTQIGYHKVEDVRWMFLREATPEEKDAIGINLAWLEERVTEDENGCWVWNGFVTKGDQPQCRITISPFVHATMLVRRLVARMKFEPSEKFKSAVSFMRHRQAGVKEGCSPGCCHPDHIVLRTKKQAMKRRAGIPLTIDHKIRISVARRKNSRIDDATIRAMLSDPRPGSIVAAELGVHASYVPHVRTGRIRTYSARSVNIFTGLLAPANGAFYDQEKAA